MDQIVLTTSENPRVSVVVLSQHSPWLLAECLEAVAAHAGREIPYELILILNNASDDVVLFVQRQVVGARVVVSEVNLGFGGGCNHAARLARGEFLLLLNDDAIVEPGWLDALVQTLDAHPEAAAAGSRIMFPDGSLQEAGTILWADGSAKPIGRGRPAEDCAFLYRRYVDYVSACSLLIRKDAFEAAGGFDMRYFPAYYEDVDLALALRENGHKVLYEPLSEVRHHESQSSESRFKEFLFKRNGAQFREKWGPVLEHQVPADPKNPEAVAAAMHRAMGSPPRLLVIDDMLPDPGVGAGFGRMHDLIREVGFGSYAMTFYASNEPKGDPRGPGRFGVDVVLGDQDALRKHLAAPGVHYDLVLVSRPHNWDFFAEDIRRTQPDAVLVYDAEALFHKRMERQLPFTEGRAASKLRKEMEKYRALEQKIARDSDSIVCVSSTEAALLRDLTGHAPITVIEPVQPEVRVTQRDATERNGIVYVAGWLARDDDAPNVDGLRWFAREVLPHLVNAMPWVRLDVTGANPPDSVRALAGPNLRFVGFVPDLHELYDTHRVVIAPIRYGAGIKIKTLEALQYGVPVVTTQHGAEGIAVGEHTGALAVADEPTVLVDLVYRLLIDPAAWRAQRQEILAVLDEWRSRPTQTWRDVLETARREGRRVPVAL